VLFEVRFDVIVRQLFEELGLMMLPMSPLAIIWTMVFAFAGWGGWQAAATGSISGTLKDATGAPLAGVRVGAMAVSGDQATPTESGVLVSITQTDASGRYFLENVSPGRYHIVAGLVTFPTYYPGTEDISKAAVVTVGAGAALSSSYDFTPVVTSLLPRSDIRMHVAVRVVTENGQPYSGEVGVLPTSATPQTLLRGGTFPNLTIPGGFYHFDVVGLAFGYGLKSASYRGVDKGLALVTIDAPGELVLTVGALPPSQIRGVRVSGRLVDVAPELVGNPRTLRLRGFGQTVMETPVAPDGTFEFDKVPLNNYDFLLTDMPGVWMKVGVPRDQDVRDLEVSLRNHPFPEFSAGANPKFFDTGQPLTLKSTVTQSVLRVDAVAPVHYFRIEVKDETSGKTVPWAVLLYSRGSPQNLIRLLRLEVGTPVVVTGAGPKDGTNRIYAFSANGVNGMAIPNALTP
jgi:hypothetical protein